MIEKIKLENINTEFQSENKEYFESILNTNRELDNKINDFNFYNVDQAIRNHKKNKNTSNILENDFRDKLLDEN